ncbi:MAG: NAD(P)-dependent alcohol dehydrogenase [Thermoplasmata archaeon]|nr:NAD(P)-dependent alcohol dehydrogenase [Thermoplasmata archaeon]
MRAIAWTAYGPPDVLRPTEIPCPMPRDGDVLVRIRATTVTAGDCVLRGLKFTIGVRLLLRLIFGVVRPRGRVLGQELAGDVEAIGPGVRELHVGDRVIATTGFRFGAYAEYICLPGRSRGGAVARMPTNLTYEEAAAVPTGGLEALHFLRRAGDLRGRDVLIVGAGGAIGTLALQMAKHRGATVTAVELPAKLALVRSLGADHVMDGLEEEFTRGGRTYDVVFDVIGRSGFGAVMACVRENGCYVLGNPSLSAILRGRWANATGRKRVITGSARHTAADLAMLTEQIEAGTLRPRIDRTFPLERAAEAHAYVESGLATGRVVLTV